MNMIILSEENAKELKQINENNSHLSRSLEPLSLKDGSLALSSEVLADEATWSRWIDFLSTLPQREVSGDELDIPEIDLV